MDKSLLDIDTTIVHRSFLEKLVAILHIFVPIALLFNSYVISISIILFCIVFFLVALIAGIQAFTKPWLQISKNTIFISFALSGEAIAINELKYVEIIRQKALVGETVRFIFHLKNQETIGFQPPQEKKILTAIVDALSPYTREK